MLATATPATQGTSAPAPSTSTSKLQPLPPELRTRPIAAEAAANGSAGTAADPDPGLNSVLQSDARHSGSAVSAEVSDFAGISAPQQRQQHQYQQQHQQQGGRAGNESPKSPPRPPLPDIEIEDIPEHEGPDPAGDIAQASFLHAVERAAEAAEAAPGPGGAAGQGSTNRRPLPPEALAVNGDPAPGGQLPARSAAAEGRRDGEAGDRQPVDSLLPQPPPEPLGKVNTAAAAADGDSAPSRRQSPADESPFPSSASAAELSAIREGASRASPSATAAAGGAATPPPPAVAQLTGPGAAAAADDARLLEPLAADAAR